MKNCESGRRFLKLTLGHLHLHYQEGEMCLIPHVPCLCKRNFEGETFSAPVYERLQYTRISTDAFHWKARTPSF